MEERFNKENFQYIWSLLLNDNGLEKEKIKFVKSRMISPYFELNQKNINDVISEKNKKGYTIETNPFFRFDDVYSLLLNPDAEIENKNLKESLLNITLHLLGNFDLYAGQTKKDFYCKEIVRDMESGAVGEKVRNNLLFLNMKEKLIIAEVFLEYDEGRNQIKCLKKIVKKFFSESIVYDNKYSDKNIVIYLGHKKDIKTRKITGIINELFIPLGLKPKYFYEYHFGVLGIGETLVIGNMAVY